MYNQFYHDVMTHTVDRDKVFSREYWKGSIHAIRRVESSNTTVGAIENDT